jgi:PST family polysaccharide transporter
MERRIAVGDDPLATEEHREDAVEDVAVDRVAVATGVRWSSVSLVFKQATRIGFGILLARLLGPENFGIIAQATIYLAFTAVFLDVGVASSLIQQKTVNRKLIGTATTINLAVLGTLVAVTLIGAPFWAALFNTPELTSVLRVLSITFVFNGFAVVPAALLTRRMQFKRLGLAEVASSVIGGIAGVIAALAGAEYWALVILTLTHDAVWLAILLATTGRPIIGWSRNAFHKIASFSRNVFGAQLLSFVGQNADNFLIGWRLGAVPLANYALSYRTLTLPLQVLGQTANRVIFPVFSRIVDDRQRQARYFSAALTGVSLFVLLPMTVVALAAPEAVPLVFGADWHGAIRPMQILAVSAVLRIISSVSSAVILANGRANWVFRMNLISIPTHVAGFIVGLQWGIEGVAWSFLVVALPLTTAWLALTSRLIPLGALGQIRALAPSVTSAVAATLGWWTVDQFASSAGFGALLAQAGVSVLVGLLAVALLWRSAARELADFVRLVVFQTQKPEVPA